MKLKRILSLIITIILCLTFAACESTESTVSTSPSETAATDERTPENAEFEEVVFVDNENCTFKITSIDPDSLWGYTLNAYLENKTDKNLMFALDDVSVNGFMCDPFWANSVQAGKKAKSDINFFEDSFTELGIENVETIEFILRIYDEDNFEASDIINEKFTFNP